MAGNGATAKLEILDAQKCFLVGQHLLALCPLCGRVIQEGLDGWDVHEWLLPRGRVHPRLQEHILSPMNQVAVHHDCHISNSWGEEQRVACAWMAMRARKPGSVVGWILGLPTEIRPPAPYFPPAAFGAGNILLTVGEALTTGKHFISGLNGKSQEELIAMWESGDPQAQEAIRLGVMADYVLRCAVRGRVRPEHRNPPAWWNGPVQTQNNSSNLGKEEKDERDREK